ncbi:MAG: 4-hydroxy-tetrahydrodipicolinate reductase [Vampirovibrio sp.]|nr:4-hydroxy-tetrahydrodipicolinate reductase [Vampirovibrio sp.]
MSPISVAVSGALGKMGREVVKTVLADSELTLAGVVDLSCVGQDVATAIGLSESCGILVQESLTAMLTEKKPQVCVDFTHPSSALSNTLAIVDADCRPVIGTTGLSDADMEAIRQALNTKKLGGMVVPNFAIGAVLMMKFAKEASKYLDHAEIIELHHNQKADAPSGTADNTAKGMVEALKESGKSQFGSTNKPEKEMISGARGALVEGNLRIHSVRLPGFVAHQEVIFGSSGQILTLRHDSLDRACFMPGVALSAKKVVELTGLVIGLEDVL